MCWFHFFFHDTATTEIYTLSLHDALPISRSPCVRPGPRKLLPLVRLALSKEHLKTAGVSRSEEHTSELQSRQYLVCRLLLEKKKTTGEPPSRCTQTSTGHYTATSTSRCWA